MSGKDALGGMVVMYGAPPIDPDLPWVPGPFQPSPFTPGIQPVPGTLPQPPFTVAQGGPEPIEQIVSRIETRIAELKVELSKVDHIRAELALLGKMLSVWKAAQPAQPKSVADE